MASTGANDKVAEKAIRAFRHGAAASILGGMGIAGVGLALGGEAGADAEHDRRGHEP